MLELILDGINADNVLEWLPISHPTEQSQWDSKELKWVFWKSGDFSDYIKNSM